MRMNKISFCCFTDTQLLVKCYVVFTFYARKINKSS